MKYTFTGDPSFMFECDDARSEFFELGADDMFDILHDADAGDLAPDNETADDFYGDDVGDGWSGEWGVGDD